MGVFRPGLARPGLPRDRRANAMRESWIARAPECLGLRVSKLGEVQRLE